MTFTSEDRDRVFEAAREDLTAQMGHVSIVKFLGASDEDGAKARWFGALEDYLAELPEGMFRAIDTASHEVVLRFSAGVAITLRLWELQSEGDLADSWRAALWPASAPLIVDAVAVERWGHPWTDAVRDAASGVELEVGPGAEEPFGDLETRVRGRWAAESGVDIAAARGWIARGAPTDAPWPWFTDRAHADRAAQALGLGPTRIAELYAAWGDAQ